MLPTPKFFGRATKRGFAAGFLDGAAEAADLGAGSILEALRTLGWELVTLGYNSRKKEGENVRKRAKEKEKRSTTIEEPFLAPARRRNRRPFVQTPKDDGTSSTEAKKKLHPSLTSNTEEARGDRGQPSPESDDAIANRAHSGQMLSNYIAGLTVGRASGARNKRAPALLADRQPECAAQSSDDKSYHRIQARAPITLRQPRCAHGATDRSPQPAVKSKS